MLLQSHKLLHSLLSTSSWVRTHCRPLLTPWVTGLWITLFHHSLTSKGFTRRNASSIHRSFTWFWIGVPAAGVVVTLKKYMFRKLQHIVIARVQVLGPYILRRNIPDKIQRRLAFRPSTALLIWAFGFLTTCPSSKTTLSQLILWRGLLACICQYNESHF